MKFVVNSGKAQLSKVYELPEVLINLLKEVLPTIEPLLPVKMTFVSEDKEHIEISIFVPCPNGQVEVSDIVVAACATEALMNGIVNAIINANNVHKIFCQNEQHEEDVALNTPKKASIYMDATEGKGEIVRNALIECLGMSRDQANCVVFRIPGLLVKDVPMDKVDMFMKAMDQVGIAKYVRIEEPCLESE